MTGFAVALRRSDRRNHALVGDFAAALGHWFLAPFPGGSGLSLATAFWLPGASYLFVWPTSGRIARPLHSRASSRPDHPMAWVATFLGSMPALLLVAPLIRTTFDGLSLPMTAPIMVLVVLFTGS